MVGDVIVFVVMTDVDVSYAVIYTCVIVINTGEIGLMSRDGAASGVYSDGDGDACGLWAMYVIICLSWM